MSNRITKGLGLFGRIETDTLAVAGRDTGISPFTGKNFFVDPLNGSDNYSGKSLAQAFATLGAGYAALRTGKNDTLVLVGNGAAAGSAFLSAGLAWEKDAAHMIGIAAPTQLSQRARIAPTAGVTAFANLFTVSGNGCYFGNLQWVHEFTTGTTAQICMTITGLRNVFDGCHLAGMVDAASAASATSRSLKISAGEENYFHRCTIGVDTISRGVANASVQFAAGSTRNIFRDCIFPFMCGADTPLGIIVAAAAGSDRFQLFDRCLFINAIKSTSTAMAGLCTLAAAMGGMLVFKDCTLIGITEYGTDATSRAQIYVDGAVVDAGASGIAVNPT